MPVVSTAGNSIACQQIGSGPDLVFIHGLGANRAFWQGQVALGLHQRFRLTMYDLRGHGYSDMTESGYHPAAMADDLAAVIEQLDCKDPILVGHSYGGQVALQFAASHPERVAGLIILDARVNSLQPIMRMADSDAFSERERALIERTRSSVDWDNVEDLGVRFLEEAARHQTGIAETDAPADEDELPFGGRRGGRRMAQRWLRLLDTTSARRDFSMPQPSREQLRQIPHRAFLAYGGRSRCLPSMRGLAETLPQASWTVLPRAGHFFPLTRPQLVLRLLRAFTGGQPMPALEGRFGGQE